MGVGRVYLKMYIKIREEGTSLKNVVLSKLFNTPRPPPANYLYIYMTCLEVRVCKLVENALERYDNLVLVSSEICIIESL